MLTEDLSFVAEALLAICEKDVSAPFLPDQALSLKLSQEKKREPVVDQVLRQFGDDELRRGEFRAIFAGSRLTARQTSVLEKRLDGWTFEEIGHSSGCTKQGAQRVFVQALKKLARSLRVYPLAGLSDVYRAEIRRGVKPGRSSVKCV